MTIHNHTDDGFSSFLDLTDLGTIKPLLQQHNLWADKSLGQNFLINREVLNKITEAAQIQKTDTILEIGPGLGVLTRELAKLAQTVHSIEIDPKMLPILSETLHDHNNVKIIPGNALKIPVANIIPEKESYKIVANIPYYITSPLLNHFLQSPNPPTSLTLLVQQEVAEKICRKEPDMSVLSLQVHLFGQPKLISIVKSKDFYPAPKVNSAILHIDTHQPQDSNFIPTTEALKILKTAHQAFLNGRKKLSNTIPHLKKELIDNNLQDQRPQHLSIQNWKTLLQ